ncbi:hypothetical protein AAIR98_000054 [Elusimicrobium simillimum]|uniref:hypothetical protein n=1 Tax=Elusimicrobium simillimum TaxID=3143438 RepID=UPI003C6ED8A0
MANLADANRKVKLEIGKLQNLVSILTKGVPKVKVGILGEKNGRRAVEHNEVKSGKNKGNIRVKKLKASSLKTNSEIGYENEFGVISGKNRKPEEVLLSIP